MAVLHLQPCRDCPGAIRRRAALDALNDAARSVIATVHTWRWRLRERAQLARLDDRMLQDIGLTHADREFLVNKPFWRA
jgi:uncharacterized protein YjiS (DUF1127 family)